MHYNIQCHMLWSYKILASIWLFGFSMHTENMHSVYLYTHYIQYKYIWQNYILSSLNKHCYYEEDDTLLSINNMALHIFRETLNQFL